KATSLIFTVVDSTSFHESFYNSMFEELESNDTSLIPNKQKSKTHLLVKRDPAKFDPYCVKGDHTCLDDLIQVDTSGLLPQFKSFSIKGVTLIGLEDLDEKTQDLISDLNYEMPADVIFLEENAEPQGTFMSILMTIGGALGLLAVLVYSFRSN
ncbi:MAG: hypothetical protein ACKOYC_03975, partial [Bacteroidota bacterium]